MSKFNGTAKSPKCGAHAIDINKTPPDDSIRMIVLS